ncbi:hypothetical protein FGG08_000515 [Glutinoglossum americanum]|uniref:WSC domain-containing protein n=1 Tax=Glutinoglossum americanum TaxID=1670608 RepID=A0A9P8I8R6_9PEZI|nr:hypothetical protein FGG08_000515 [Glutinoglossum americanum]
MDPATVDSPIFGLLWKLPFNSKEQFYAKPLVYTPSGGKQLVFLASSQNYIRTLDAVTGAIINSRQVQTPFLQADIGCNDIPNTIGITGTPVIDSDIAYFFVKTYIPNYRQSGATGYINGVYYFYAVNVNTLQDVPGFPILVDGTVAQNDPLKYFVGGVILQRPALTKLNNVVYGAFGGHCDLFNYTGMVIGVNTQTATVVSAFAMESGPFARHDPYNVNGGGGEAGIWMSGMGLASDGNRIFAVTGNGQGHQNNGVPATGRSGLQTLDEAIVNLGVDPSTGLLSLTDYFEPYDYQNMDAGDRDLGSGGIALLDPSFFSGAGVARMGVTAGKNGKIYVVNADNLGGYRLGVGQTDGIVQTIVTNQAVFGGIGSYPLEGGYIYLTPVGNTTSVYKIGHDDSGAPVFTWVGQSNEASAGRVGCGVPTITTFQGQAGTAILWLTDVDAGLRAWHAVPQNGVLKTINLPQTNGLNKFQRPAFGDGRVYVTDSNGVLYCMGSPVSLPLNCTSPVQFGNVALGSVGTQTVNCTANIPITKIVGANVGDTHFQVSNSSLPSGSLAKGQSFSFPVTWNLTNVVVTNAQNASFGNTQPGVKSTALTVFTMNGVAGFSTQFPISLTGTEVSSSAFLTLSPLEVDFGGVVISNTTSPTITSSFVISNAGLANMTILGYAWATTIDDDSDIVFTNSTPDGTGTYTLSYGFSSTNLPAVGSAVSPGQSLSVPMTFNAINGTGTYGGFFFVWTDGGSGYIVLSASASTAPIAELTISNGEGGWLPPSTQNMDFGNVAVGNSSTLQIRICNTGGSVLTITKSKPPGQSQLTATAPGVDLHEGQLIPVGTCATGGVIFQPAIEAPNILDQTIADSWTLNTDDLTFGIHVVSITGTVVDRKVGPLLPDGTTRYRFLGCYQDGTNGRLLPKEFNNPNTNENGQCQTECLGGNYIFAGTEYKIECWCGNTPPPSAFFFPESAQKCTFACAGDGSQSCGGNGGFISIYYDATRYNPHSLGARALSTLALASDSMTIELCLSTCWNYKYVGVEYSRECWCGQTLNAGSTNQSQSHCTMVCKGDGFEYCGSGGYLDLYLKNPPSTTASTTVTSSTTSLLTTMSALNTTVSTAPTANTTTATSTLDNTMTITSDTASVTTISATNNTTTAPTTTSGTTTATPAANNSMTTTSAGNGTTITTPTDSAISITTSSSPSATSSSATSSSAAAYTGPPVVVPGNINFTLYSGGSAGCVQEPTGVRALPNLFASDSMTIELCLSFAWNYKFAGVEYGRECWYGNTLNAGASVAPSQSSCNMACKGNTSEFCGAGSLLTLYQKKSLVSSSSSVLSPTSTTSNPSASSIPSVTVSSTGTTIPTTAASDSSTTASAATSTSVTTVSTSITTSTGTPTPSVVPGNANFTLYQNTTSSGCVQEPSGARALPSLYANDSMTVELCLSFASSYKYAGIEYSRECWYGNTLNAGAVLASAQSSCNMLCKGNKLEYCGGSSR